MTLDQMAQHLREMIDWWEHEAELALSDGVLTHDVIVRMTFARQDNPDDCVTLLVGTEPGRGGA